MRKAMYMMGILDDGDVAWLAEHGERKTVSPGGLLIQEGKAADSLFVLLAGELGVRTSAAGEIARLYAGEIVGEISFVDSRPPTATVEAIHACQVLGVSRSALRAKLARDDAFAANFYRSVAMFLADRLRSTLNRGKVGADDSEELNDELLDNTSLGAARFDKLLRSS